MDLLASGFVEGLRSLAAFTLRSTWWMGWNLMLAWIPVGLALLLFRSRPHRSGGPDNRHPRRQRGVTWWFGALLFILFLPNAPYIVTDLVHLRSFAASTSHNEFVLVVLPAFAVFVALAYLAYDLCLRLLDNHLAELGATASRRRWLLIGVHAVCAVGVVLGRVARLNSWEAVTEPRGTGETILATLTWTWAPFAIGATFLAIWTFHTLTRGVIDGVLLPWWSRMQHRLGGSLSF